MQPIPTFERLLGVGLLLHESVYLADWGWRYYQRCFAPALGLRVAGLQRAVLHLLHAAAALVVVIDPRPATLGVLALTLSLVIAAYPVRLSNHLVLAWFFLIGALLLDGRPVELENYLLWCLVLMFAAAGFAKLNASYFRPSTSCGEHFARVLLSLWGFRRLRDSRLVTWIAGAGIVTLELTTGLLLVPLQTRPLAIALALLLMTAFGLLCHVHFATIVLAALAALAGPLAFHPSFSWAAGSVVGAVLAWRFGNWKFYRAATWAAVNHVVFGVLTGIAVLVVATLPARSDAVWAAPHLPHGVSGLLVGLFALNCATPYLGVKTSFSFAMFSNLRPDVWDHFIIPRPALPFRVGYVGLQGIDRLPALRCLDDDPQLRRIVSELHLWQYRRYAPGFLAEAQRVLAEEGFGEISFLPAIVPTRTRATRRVRIVAFPGAVPAADRGVCE